MIKRDILVSNASLRECFIRLRINADLNTLFHIKHAWFETINYIHVYDPWSLTGQIRKDKICESDL